MKTLRASSPTFRYRGMDNSKEYIVKLIKLAAWPVVMTDNCVTQKCNI